MTIIQISIILVINQKNVSHCILKQLIKWGVFDVFYLIITHKYLIRYIHSAKPDV